MKINPGSLQPLVNSAIADCINNQVIERIWERDFRVWKPYPDEISNRLGWLSIAEEMEANIPKLFLFVNDIQSAGFIHVLLLGMGGSSLAPEVFHRTFVDPNNPLDFSTLDSTHPDTILENTRKLDISKTLFIVSTKSGGTVETISLFKYFFNQVAHNRDEQSAGNQFVAITDPGSSVAHLAEKHRFRDIFLNTPEIGGRYSALSYFGLLPAALVGVDLETLLERAAKMAKNCKASNNPVISENPCLPLGVIMGALAKIGRDKLTLFTSDTIASFGDWLEQLVAESTGKEGKGILPIIGEPVGAPDTYGNDRLFVYLKLSGDDTLAARIQSLEDAGHPVINLSFSDRYDLGGQFFLWQLATSVAGYFLQINPFNQPDVEASKILARRMVEEYQQNGILPEIPPSISSGDISVFGETSANNSQDALLSFISQAQPGAYIALQAFLPPSPEVAAAMQELRLRLHTFSGLAVTSGFGPRYLHSTGQLHKGDAGKGLFIQITGENVHDIPIPDTAGSDKTSLTFGILKNAQALGDFQALSEAGRKVLRFHIFGDPLDGLNQLTGYL